MTFWMFCHEHALLVAFVFLCVLGAIEHIVYCWIKSRRTSR